LRNAAVKAREIEPETFIPYVRHVNETVIGLRSGAVMTVIQLEGVPFETVDHEDIGILHDQLNILWRNISDDRLAVWSHIVRRRETGYPGGHFPQLFAHQLNEKYKARLVGTDLYRNDLYLTLLWLPAQDHAAKASAFLSKLMQARARGTEAEEESIKKLGDATRDAIAKLDRYNPRVLGLVDRDGILFSEPMEMLNRIVSGEQVPLPLVQGTIASALYTSRVIFGRETIEFRGAGQSRYGGMFGVKEYPASTKPGMLNGLLKAPFEFILTQSYGFMAKAAAATIMTRKQNQMLSANDKAVSQLVELNDALDDLQSNRFVMGEHHLTMLVYADTLRDLPENMSIARAMLASGGAVIAREDLGLEAAFWSQLPGNFKYRARSGAITSRNFAAMSPFHGYPQGKAEHNHWGPAVALLKTPAGSPYYFNFHFNDLGNTFICGPSGSGKTVSMNFMLAQLLKFDPQIVLFDKDRGADLFIRAVGGSYLPLKNGMETGCAPFKALDLTPDNLVFLSRFIRKLVEAPGRPALPVSEEKSIDVAIRSLGNIPKHKRSLGALSMFLDRTNPDGAFARLQRWINGGPLGWVFDAQDDRISLDARTIGFDMTEFLDNPEIRTPMMMYLFYRVEQLITGQPIVIAIDEFWKALSDEAFSDLAQNKLKTIRKQNGFMLFATQSPKDALKSDIAHTIIEQCPTKLFFPNPRGDGADYVDGFKLSEREFELISREMTSEARQFLIKQDQSSVVAELNLSGMPDEIAILSARTETVDLAERVIAEVGSADPAAWLPHFHKLRRRT
jgi:type IV secretion system protein VirB4